MTYIGKDANAVHDMRYGMLHDDGFELEEKKQSTCKKCASPCQVVSDVRKEIPDRNTDLCAVLDDCAEIFKLYLAHLLRCHLQEREIERIFDEVTEGAKGVSVTILLDYKMKFQPMFNRDPTAQPFGKNGISGHGSGLF